MIQWIEFITNGLVTVGTPNALIEQRQKEAIQAIVGTREVRHSFEAAPAESAA